MNELHVAIAEDNPQMMNLLNDMLEQENGFRVVAKADNGEDAYEMIMKTNPDLVLMDVIMPKLDGISVMERVKKEWAGKQMPSFIMVTAAGSEQVASDAFQMGASYYIMKPFSMQELLARVKMHLRREERTKGNVHQIKIGKLILYTDSKELFVNDDKIALTRREFDIVNLLASNPSKIYSIEEIYNYLYPQSSEALLRSVSEYIYQIRQKLKPYQLNPIKTLYGGGYQWVESKVLDN